ncbi:hypothetical protein D555_3933 [Bordetella holmesii 35009]|nr:hypothetical protein D555_3933 [Bordetella holmesii 35009]
MQAKSFGDADVSVRLTDATAPLRENAAILFAFEAAPGSGFGAIE